MTTTVVGLFEAAQDAQRAGEALIASGVEPEAIKRVLGSGKDASALSNLTAMGIPHDEAVLYAQGVKRGETLLVALVADAMGEQAADIMARHHMLAIDGLDARRGQHPQHAEAQMHDFTQSDTLLPVIEEELEVGKREVERGRTRITTHMTETPVEEQVQLREEQISVQRRPVDRPVSDADRSAFKEGVIEVTETDEEAVVSKTARVVEEVRIDKDVQEHTETIRDTLRQTDVEVEQIDPSQDTQAHTAGTPQRLEAKKHTSKKRR